MRNSSLVEEFGVDNNRASSVLPKLWNWQQLVGEHSMSRRRFSLRNAGGDGKANVGISNDKEGENPSRRKTKGS